MWYELSIVLFIVSIFQWVCCGWEVPPLFWFLLLIYFRKIIYNLWLHIQSSTKVVNMTNFKRIWISRRSNFWYFPLWNILLSFCGNVLKCPKFRRMIHILFKKCHIQNFETYWDIYNCVSTSLTTFLSSAMLKPQSDIF